jgi:ubiquinone/menaquinone biosynthesis C-methylase UbiE
MARSKGSDWEKLSNWYDKKQGDIGDLWHRTLIDPVLLHVIGSCRGKDVLDLGCGNGYLARRFAKQRARVTAIDASYGMIRNAEAHDPKNRLKIHYLQRDAARLEGVADSSFDLVFANMSLMDIKDAKSAISEVGRILKTGGRFVASISHPCFDNGSESGWVLEKSMGPGRIYRRIRAYRKPSADKIPWNVEGKKNYTFGYHRPLNWYANVFHSNRLAITRLEEPMPTEEFFKLDKPGDIDALGFPEVPLHLVIETIKL